MQRFQDPSQEFHLSKSPSDARPKSSCTALRASCAAARKISPTATLRMMPEAPELQVKLRRNTAFQTWTWKNTIQTTQDVSSFSNYARHSKHRKRLQSISIRVKILQTNPGSTTSGEELGPKGTLHSLDRFPRTRPQNKTSIPQSPSWKQGWLSCFCGFNMMPLEPKMLNRTQVRSLRKRHATSMQKWSAFKV